MTPVQVGSRMESVEVQMTTETPTQGAGVSAKLAACCAPKPYVSVTMPILHSDSKFIKLLIPLRALSIYEDPKAKWFWMPERNDGYDINKWLQDAGENFAMSEASSFRVRARLFDDNVTAQCAPLPWEFCWDLRKTRKTRA